MGQREGRLHIIILTYQYKDSFYKDKTIGWQSHMLMGIYTRKDGMLILSQGPTFMLCTWFNMWNVVYERLGPWFTLNMSYQYRKFDCGDEAVIRSSYLHNGNSYTGKTASLCWINHLFILLIVWPCAASSSYRMQAIVSDSARINKCNLSPINVTLKNWLSHSCPTSTASAIFSTRWSEWLSYLYKFALSDMKNRYSMTFDSNRGIVSL